jgi:hypothetical protein
MGQKPFQQLSETDQKAAIDIGICVSVLGARLPSCGKPLFDYVASEYVKDYGIPANIAKYALRQVGEALFTSEWTFTIQKTGQGLVTSFKRVGDNGDGDSPLQEYEIIH